MDEIQQAVKRILQWIQDVRYLETCPHIIGVRADLNTIEMEASLLRAELAAMTEAKEKAETDLAAMTEERTLALTALSLATGEKERLQRGIVELGRKYDALTERAEQAERENRVLNRMVEMSTGFFPLAPKTDFISRLRRDAEAELAKEGDHA